MSTTKTGNTNRKITPDTYMQVKTLHNNGMKPTYITGMSKLSITTVRQILRSNDYDSFFAERNKRDRDRKRMKQMTKVPVINKEVKSIDVKPERKPDTAKKAAIKEAEQHLSQIAEKADAKREVTERKSYNTATTKIKSLQAQVDKLERVVKEAMVTHPKKQSIISRLFKRQKPGNSLDKSTMDYADSIKQFFSQRIGRYAQRYQ